MDSRPLSYGALTLALSHRMGEGIEMDSRALSYDFLDPLYSGRARESFQRSSRGNEALINLSLDGHRSWGNDRANEQPSKVFEPRYLGCYVLGRALPLYFTELSWACAGPTETL